MDLSKVGKENYKMVDGRQTTDHGPQQCAGPIVHALNANFLKNKTAGIACGLK